jgi:hypothetical protein
MRFIGKAVSVLLVAATIVTLVPGLLWAGAECTTPDCLLQGIVNPSASGTKVSGPLTIFYELAAVPTSTCEAGLQITQFSVVMQLTKGNTLATFSGKSVPSTKVCSPGISEQITFIQGLIAAEVIPTFFGPGATNPFEFKVVTAISSTQSPGFGDDPNTTAFSMNVILAVH